MHNWVLQWVVCAYYARYANYAKITQKLSKNYATSWERAILPELRKNYANYANIGLGIRVRVLVGIGDWGMGGVGGAALVRPATVGGIHLTSRLYFGVSVLAGAAGGATTLALA